MIGENIMSVTDKPGTKFGSEKDVLGTTYDSESMFEAFFQENNNEDDIIRDGSHIENGKLKPNIKYQSGEHEYIYETNDDGLICHASTQNLQLKIHTGRLEHDPNTYDKAEEDHAGHLFGDRFGGSPELDNLVSQAKRVNLSEFKIIENIWARELNKEDTVITVDITILYGDTRRPRRPTGFNIIYTINGEIFKKEIDN